MLWIISENNLTELHDFPHARSMKAIKALAKYRGASIGVNAAEAFRVERLISKT